jgi:hypothetical protein
VRPSPGIPPWRAAVKPWHQSTASEKPAVTLDLCTQLLHRRRHPRDNNTPCRQPDIVGNPLIYMILQFCCFGGQRNKTVVLQGLRVSAGDFSTKLSTIFVQHSFFVLPSTS